MNKDELYSTCLSLTATDCWHISSLDKTKNPITVSDGPCGVRQVLPLQEGYEPSISTAFPAPSALACTFDEKIPYEVGKLIAHECTYRKIDVILAPGVNIKRSALCGRDFEYFSEDPCLAGVLAANWIRGAEENGIGTSLKHFALNNQELARHINSSEVSDRALHEIYLRSFEYAVKKGKPSSVMCSYNRYEGELASQSQYLLEDVLRKDWKYQGLTISDWTAVGDKAAVLAHGVDIQFPYAHLDKDYLYDNYQSQVFIDADLKRHLDRLKHFEDTLHSKKKNLAPIDYKKQYQLTLKLADETPVLLKNEGLLPLKKKDRIVIVGYLADQPHIGGGGSAEVNAYAVPSMTNLIKQKKINATVIQGYDSTNLVALTKDDRKLIQEADKVVIVLGLLKDGETEGGDRSSIDLADGQLETVKQIGELNHNLIAIIESGSVINLYPINQIAKAIIVSYCNGECTNQALLDNLYGLHNPCGKLPETWISSLTSNPLYEDWGKSVFTSYYDEDIYVGYRYYDENNNKGVMYHFGFGLSYSKFVFSNINHIHVKGNEVSFKFDLRNSSKISGKEKVQVYVSKLNSALYREKKGLKAFKSIALQPLTSKSVSMVLDKSAFEVYDIVTKKFVVEDGTYLIQVGDSSVNLPLSFKVTLKGKKLHESKEIPVLKRKHYAYEDTFSFLSPNLYIMHSPLLQKIIRPYFSNEQSANWNLTINNYEPYFKCVYEMSFHLEAFKKIIAIANNFKVAPDFFNGISFGYSSKDDSDKFSAFNLAKAMDKDLPLFIPLQANTDNQIGCGSISGKFSVLWKDYVSLNKNRVFSLVDISNLNPEQTNFIIGVLKSESGNTKKYAFVSTNESNLKMIPDDYEKGLRVSDTSMVSKALSYHLIFITPELINQEDIQKAYQSGSFIVCGVASPAKELLKQQYLCSAFVYKSN
jgi:beta-glucosidase